MSAVHSLMDIISAVLEFSEIYAHNLHEIVLQKSTRIYRLVTVFSTIEFFFLLLSSYLHCRWADLVELEKDKRIHQKVKRFKAKQQLNSFITEVREVHVCVQV